MSKILNNITYTILLLGLSTSFAPLANSVVLYEKDGVSFDIFGKIAAGYFNEAAYQDQSGDHSFEQGTVYPYARLGLAMRSEIAHGLDGIAMTEWETTTAKGHHGGFDNTRYMFVGLDAYQYGTLAFGRGNNAFYGIVGATDIFNTINSNASDYYLFGEQRNSLIMYSLHALDWDLKLSYEFPHHDLGETPFQAKRGLAASVSSKFGENITIAYGFDYYKFDTNYNQDATSLFFAKMLAFDRHISFDEALSRVTHAPLEHKIDYGLALSYGFVGDMLYASTVFVASDYDYLEHFVYSIDSVISYNASDSFGVNAGYGTRFYDGKQIISELTLGAYYNFNSAFKVFAEAQFDIDGDAQSFYVKEICERYNFNEDKFALGAEFSF